MPETKFGPPPAISFERTPTKDEIAFFHENGFLAVDRITTDEEIDWMRQIFEYIFDAENAGKPGGPVDRSGKLRPGEKSKLSQSFFPEMQYPALLETNYRKNAKRFAAALLGVDESRLSSWGHMIMKPAGSRDVPWHQDHAYWQPELDYHALGVWAPMHDCPTEMGAMQFIPGSHRRGLMSHAHNEDPAHNILKCNGDFDPATAVPCPLKKGGCTFHHSETLHYTAPNVTGAPRLAFPMEFQLAPVRRATPDVMPWVDEHRAALGATPPLAYVADGQFITV